MFSKMFLSGDVRLLVSWSMLHSRQVGCLDRVTLSIKIIFLNGHTRNIIKLCLWKKLWVLQFGLLLYLVGSHDISHQPQCQSYVKVSENSSTFKSVHTFFLAMIPPQDFQTFFLTKKQETLSPSERQLLMLTALYE